MNRLDTGHTSVRGAVDARASHTRLTGSRLMVARIVWLALVIPSLLLFVASLPVYYAQLQKACVDVVTCNIEGALSQQGLKDLSALDLSVSVYAALIILFFLIIVGIWSGIGFLIFWRRSDEWFALLTAFFLVMFNITYPGFPMSTLSLVYPALTGPIIFLGALGLASLAMFLVLFPNGRLVPRWMGLFLVLAIISTVSTVIPPTSRFSSNNVPGWLYGVLNILVFGSIIFSQIYRYRRVSTLIERQQTKWVVSGIIVMLIGVFVVFPLISFSSPTLNQQHIPTPQIFGLVTYPLVLLLIPLSVGFAILRYRLYDIDRIINRTLVYGSLTIILALIYFGLIFAIQYLLSGIISRNNDVAIVIATLAIAALFQPLRHATQ